MECQTILDSVSTEYAFCLLFFYRIIFFYYYYFSSSTFLLFFALLFISFNLNSMQFYFILNYNDRHNYLLLLVLVSLSISFCFSLFSHKKNTNKVKRENNREKYFLSTKVSAVSYKKKEKKNENFYQLFFLQCCLRCDFVQIISLYILGDYSIVCYWGFMSVQRIVVGLWTET